MRTECTQPFRNPVECGQTLYARVTTRNIDNDQLTLYIFRSSNNGENPKSNYVYYKFEDIGADGTARFRIETSDTWVKDKVLTFNARVMEGILEEEVIVKPDRDNSIVRNMEHTFCMNKNEALLTLYKKPQPIEEGQSLTMVQEVANVGCAGKYCIHIDGAILVAKYIVEEIKRNTRSNIAESIRYYASFDEYKKRFEEWRKRNIVGLLLTPPPEPPNLIKAKVLWTERVFAGRPWDHKPKIKKMFSHVAVERTEYSNVKKKMISFKSYYHKYKEYDYFYDVWSNIHYGYLGLSVGFDRKTLLGGADLAQIIDSSGNNSEDAIDDKIAIKIGFSLYEKFGRYAKYLTAQNVLNALDTATMKESKKKHICLK